MLRSRAQPDRFEAQGNVPDVDVIVSRVLEQTGEVVEQAEPPSDKGG